MAIDVNPQKIRKRLIRVYEQYLSREETVRREAEEEAKELDGLWSGSQLLDPEVESAIGGLRYLYLDPRLPEKKAKEILASLRR